MEGISVKVSQSLKVYNHVFDEASVAVFLSLDELDVEFRRRFLLSYVRCSGWQP